MAFPYHQGGKVNRNKIGIFRFAIWLKSALFLVSVLAKEQKGSKAASLIDYKPEQVEDLIADLANQGLTPAQIGMSLRDQHGVKNVKKLLGVNLEKVLEKKGMQGDMPRDLLNLISRSVVLQRHMHANKKDMTAKRGYQLAVSRIRKLTNYCIKNKKLDKDWRYTPEAAELLVK